MKKFGLAFSPYMPLRRGASSAQLPSRLNVCMKRGGTRPGTGARRARNHPGGAREGRNTSDVSPNRGAEDLLRDARRFRSKSRSDDTVVEATYGGVKQVLDTVMVWNFFLVVALLLWLVVALAPHYLAHNDVLLDPWLSLWKGFTQPVLGVLMLGTIVQGLWSYMFQ